MLQAIKNYSKGKLGTVKKSRKRRKLILKSDLQSDSEDGFVGVSTSFGVKDALDQLNQKFCGRMKDTKTHPAR